MASVIVPLIKDKCGDVTDVNNYRAIAISCAFSKIFESLIASYIQSVNVVGKYQFGFKPRHSTSLCTSILKQTVDHFTSRGSHVFVCFVDFKKAFDSVNHWKLLDKILDDNVNYKLVKLLGFWFSRQVYCVRWTKFTVELF